MAGDQEFGDFEASDGAAVFIAAQDTGAEEGLQAADFGVTNLF